MKRFLSVLLTVCMVFGLCAVGVSASDDTLKLIVASDLHWQKFDRIDSARFYHPRNDLGQVSAISVPVVARFLEEAAESDADCILMSGDLTNMGTPDDARAFAAILADFESETGKQIYVIDGNHDVDMREDVGPGDCSPATFKEIYHAFGYDEALAVDGKTASYTADLPGGYRLLAIDSNKWEGSGDGVVSDELMAWIETQVRAAQADGRKIIAMMHHHIMEHFPLEQRIDGFYICDNYKDICKKFAQWDIRVTFTGHLHVGDIAEYNGKNKIYDVTTASLSSYPLSYRYASFTDEAITFESRYLESLDASLLPEGYSEAQREMIANDPIGYANGCLTDSLVVDYINGFVEPDALIGKLGLEPDSVIAELIRRIMPEVMLPLYGEGNTVQTQAEALGVELPASDYETVGDLITAFFAAFTRGDENVGGNSPEGKLFLDAAYTLFATKLAQESDVVRVALATKIAAQLGLKTIDNALTRTAIDLLLMNLLVDKAPADNDLTIPGYGVKRTASLWNRLTSFLRRVFDFIRRVLAFSFAGAADATVS